MSRYIRCCYCGTPLGEITDEEEVPSSAYCLSCYADSKNWTEKDSVEILQEWER